MKTDKILVINPFGIGDILFTTPLLRRLKKQFPNSSVSFICNVHVAPLVFSNRNLKEVFIFEKDDYKTLWRKNKIECIKKFLAFLKIIKSRKFDIAIDLSLGHQYAFFLMLLGVPVRIGYNYKGRGRFLTHKINIDGYHDKHVVEYHLDLFDFICRQAHVTQIKDDSKRLEIFISDEHKQWRDSFLKENGIGPSDKVVGVVAGGGASWGKTAIYKHWPAENFARAADELAERYNLKIILLGSKGELDICEAVLASMSNRPVMACGRTDLLQFAALLKRCDLVLCNDGGPLHVAVRVGAKTVSVFGPVDERVYGPYPPSAEHIVIKEDLECRPCYKGFKFQQCPDRRCLLDIKPQEVVEAAVKLLN